MLVDAASRFAAVIQLGVRARPDMQTQELAAGNTQSGFRISFGSFTNETTGATSYPK